ncbi:MAG: tetratricopeptide repeat protein [Phycisphaerales bacterium]
MNRIALLLVCLLTIVPRAQAQSTPDEPTLEESLAMLDTGIQQLETRDADAKETIARAASALSAVIEREDLHTPAAYHALGNAYALLDDYGHAVLAYRRGLEINPRDPRLRDSLDFARDQVQISVEPSPASRVRWALTAWRGFIPRIWLWSGFIALFVLAWALLIIRSATRGSRTLRTAAFWCFGLALLPVSALGYEWSINQGRDLIVITQPKVAAMSGPDDSVYDPVYSEPLDAGVEGVLLETREDWARIRLIDGSECWVPRTSYEMVNPA